MTLCAIKWCCAEAADGAYCSVHRKHRRFKPEDPSVPGEGDKIKCEECSDTGDCSLCGGSGSCQCLECADQHDCRYCNGSGDCPECEDAA